MAAGEPAAKATGRHHNVREDIGLAVGGGRCETTVATSRPSRGACNTPTVNDVLTPSAERNLAREGSAGALDGTRSRG
jgi:hypothetical protein